MEFVIACVVGWLASAAPAPGFGEPGKDPRETLETARVEMIRLLEAEDYKGLIETFAHPEDLKKILDKRSIDEVAKNFKENGKGAKLLKALKSIEGKQPEINETGDVARFKVDENAPGGGITFAKFEGLWYIRN